jgi:hypothetical protein
MKAKKGAIGLSMNMIVVVLIGVVMLGLGLGLLYKFIGGAEDIKGTLDRQTEMQLERLIDQGRTVALSTNTANVKGGDSRVIGLGVLNIEEMQTLYLEIPLGKYIDNDGNVQEDAPTETWFLYNDEGFDLDEDESKKEPISIDIPTDAPKGQYIFSIKVCKTKPCTFETQYGNTQKFAVIVG